MSLELSAATWPHGRGKLKDQGTRSADSVVLNIAEGRALTGANRRKHCRIARGSAAETSAVLDIARLAGGDVIQEKVRRVGHMVSRMTR